jgi:uracil-DNA glycosylase
MSSRQGAKKLAAHVGKLRRCRLCPGMHPPVVSGGPVVAKVLLVGQAPGDKEPKLGRPFAWTAGKTLFRWFREAAGMSEDQFRSSIYMAAVCRCFPGKNPLGGDRVPSPEEVRRCAVWLHREIEILRPALVIPVGKLAIEQFIPSQSSIGSSAISLRRFASGIVST